MIENRGIYFFDSRKDRIIYILFVVDHFKLITLLKFEKIDTPLVNIRKFVNQQIAESLCFHSF